MQPCDIWFVSSFNFRGEAHKWPDIIPDNQSFATTIGFLYTISNPCLTFSVIDTLFLLLLSTNTWVYPPTAVGTSFPFTKTPTSYSTELFPILLTRNPNSSISGNDTGAKNLVDICYIVESIEENREGRTWQCDSTTRPMSVVDVLGSIEHCSIK